MEKKKPRKTKSEIGAVITIINHDSSQIPLPTPNQPYPLPFPKIPIWVKNEEKCPACKKKKKCKQHMDNEEERHFGRYFIGKFINENTVIDRLKTNQFHFKNCEKPFLYFVENISVTRIPPQIPDVWKMGPLPNSLRGSGEKDGSQPPFPPFPIPFQPPNFLP